MENTAYLRRQAALCLRLSEFCSDPPISEHFRFMAAGFHERALRAEFATELDLLDDGLAPRHLWATPPTAWH
jgi:hypothetical protein